MYSAILLSYVMFGLQMAAAMIQMIQEMRQEVHKPLLEMLVANKKYVYTVKNFEDLKPNALTLRRIAYVEGTKSWIMGDRFSQELLSTNYAGGAGQAKRDLAEVLKANQNDSDTLSKGTVGLFKASIPTTIFNPGNILFKPKDKVYYEFSNLKVKEKVIKATHFVPFGKCHFNEASAKSTLNMGFTIASGIVSGQGGTINAIAGLGLTLSQGQSFGTQVSGAISCDIPSKATLQVQVLFDRKKVSGVRSRNLKVVQGWDFVKRIEASDWHNEDELEDVDNSNFVIACVTDPDHLKC